MAHVELSISEAFTPSPTPTRGQHRAGFLGAEGGAEVDGFDRWADTVATAAEPCLLITRDSTIAAVSPAGCQLLGFGTPIAVFGQPLLDTLRLLDFTAARGELTEQDVEKIPPLLAVSSQRLARGLLRVEGSGPNGADTTVDAIATPILGPDGAVVGSLTFFSPV
ncbi:hypothetical protein [Micromonospora sp. HM5-17]|uniref:hypothetical protein n=1 Tax=Micromonospora sp. HM5-17 TaxID=2487710 RepID=UPI000F470B68|nr:hypothetical protein [Micromonospora sp. HM5-17]ROT34324.1 hypothetical protein EF879_01930 [Micromonospora sp. HM5-17]